MNPNDYLKQKERALSRKLEIIRLKGGKCERCGYDKNIAALEFHHLDPSIKSFQLDSRHL
jgi:predicted Zn-ribbon and HTH transcriptional regulator